MPIVVSQQGWVKVPKKATARRGPPIDPVEVFRGPLEYFAGRRDPKPVLPPPQPFPPRRRRQLLLEAPPEEIPARPLRPQKSRVASEPAPRKHKTKQRAEVYEVADEEIIREDFYGDGKSVYSRRSASPVRKNRHASARHDDHRYSSSRGPCDHYPHPYPAQPYPGMQPFAMYYQAPPPMMYAGGFGGGYGGHLYGGGAPPAMIQGPEYVRERSPKKSPAASSVGSSAGSRMNYKWHSATKPLRM